MISEQIRTKRESNMTMREILHIIRELELELSDDFRDEDKPGGEIPTFNESESPRADRRILQALPAYDKIRVSICDVLCLATQTITLDIQDSRPYSNIDTETKVKNICLLAEALKDLSKVLKTSVRRPYPRLVTKTNIRRWREEAVPKRKKLR